MSEATDQALIDHVHRLARLGGWEEDLRGGLVRWSEAASELFGLEPGTGIAVRDLHSYVIAADQATVLRFAAELCAPLLRRGAGVSVPAGVPARVVSAVDAQSTTFRIVRPDDGAVRQIRVFAESVTDGGGAVIALRGAFQDVSAHYHTQVALDATRDELADTRERAAEDHRLAIRLQRAILPLSGDGAGGPDVDVAVRYRPAGQDHLVGGDWYDTLRLPGGDMLVIVGDIAGHGVEAVTGMITARNALRGLAAAGAPPAELMRLLNAALCQLPGGILGTVIAGRYQPADGTLRWARAGHLPPVLLSPAGGTVCALPLPEGMLLGLEPDAIYEQACVTLTSGDCLLLFTDGLIERRGISIGDAIDFTVAAAGAALAAGGPRSAGTLADQVLASAAADTGDDACLVVVRVR